MAKGYLISEATKRKIDSLTGGNGDQLGQTIGGGSAQINHTEILFGKTQDSVDPGDEVTVDIWYVKPDDTLAVTDPLIEVEAKYDWANDAATLDADSEVFVAVVAGEWRILTGGGGGSPMVFGVITGNAANYLDTNISVTREDNGEVEEGVYWDRLNFGGTLAVGTQVMMTRAKPLGAPKAFWRIVLPFDLCYLNDQAFSVPAGGRHALVIDKTAGRTCETEEILPCPGQAPTVAPVYDTVSDLPSDPTALALGTTTSVAGEAAEVDNGTYMVTGTPGNPASFSWQQV